MKVEIDSKSELDRRASLTLNGTPALNQTDTYKVLEEEYIWDGSALVLVDPRPRRIVILSDSEFAASYLLGKRTSNYLENVLNDNGVKCSVFLRAVNAFTFFRANTSRVFGGLTLVEKTIQDDPTDIFVAMGHNDAFTKEDARTEAQIQNDALELFTALRTALPDCNLYFLEQTPYDDTNFTAATCKNKGLAPAYMTLKSSGILQDSFCSDVLEDTVSAAVQTQIEDWETFRDYVRTLTASSVLDGSFDLQPWKPARLGLLSTDLLHNTDVGQEFLFAKIIKIGLANNLPFVSTLADQLISLWQDPDAVFDDLLSASGDGYEPSWPSGNNSSAVVYSTNPNLFLENWFHPYRPFDFEIYPTTLTNDEAPTDRLNWQIQGARPFTAVELSLAGGAFSPALRQADGQAVVTDQDGDASDSLLTGAIGLPDGNYAIRFRVGDQITSEVVLTLQTPA